MFSSDSGSGFQGSGTQITDPISGQMLQDSYGRSQGGLDQQQAFYNAIQQQNGLGNQSAVFGQQQALANQLQGVANGTGPNPALAQLNQTTANNIASQNALMAGQRGANANVGLMARQAGQQGANLQQQAVGQGATLQAQQQLAGMNALAQQQSSMGNLATAQVGQQANALNSYNQGAQNQQQSLYNSISQQNNARVGMQSNLNSVNANIAGINAQGQQAAFNGLLSGIAGGMGGGAYRGGTVKGYADGGAAPTTAPVTNDKNDSLLSKGISAIKNLGSDGNEDVVSPTWHSPNMGAYNGQELNGGITNVAAPAGTMPGMPGAIGQELAPSGQSGSVNSSAGSGPQSYVGQQLQQPTTPAQTPNQVTPAQTSVGQGMTQNSAAPGIEKTFSKLGQSASKGMMGGGGKKDDSGGGSSPMSSPMAGLQGDSGGGGGGMMSTIEENPEMLAMLASKGGKVPSGEKKLVPGDSPKNDVVPAMLSPKEIVIPRSITMGKNAPERAAKFVAHCLAKEGNGEHNYAEGGPVIPSVEDKLKEYDNAGYKLDLPPEQRRALAEKAVGNLTKWNADEDKAEGKPPVVVNVNNDPNASGQAPVTPMVEAPTRAPAVEPPMNQQPVRNPAAAQGMPANPQQGALNQLMGANTAEGSAMSALAREKASMYHDKIAQQQDFMARMDAKRAELEGEVKNASNDLKANKIDPNRYWGSLDTRHKITTTIGIILGGIGGGRTGTNAGLDAFNNQVKNDIEAQKADLGKKENLLSTNLKRFGDMNDAIKMTSAMQAQSFADGLEEAAAKTNDPVAKLRAQQANAQLKLQYGPTLQDIAMRQALASGANGLAPEERISALLPKEMQGEAFKQLKEASEAKNKYEAAMKGWDRVNSVATYGHKIKHPVDTYITGDANADQLNDAIIDLTKDSGGKPNPELRKQFEKQYKPDATDDEDERRLKRDAFARAMTQKMNYPLLNKAGVNVLGKSRYSEQGKDKLNLGKPKQ